MAVDLDESRSVEHFRLSMEQFSFKTPESSPYRRSARLGICWLLLLPPPLNLRRNCARQVDEESPKKAKKKRGYAPPETYAHLDYLTDCLAENLDVMFCGINPGRVSAEVGHHFAHPTNLFYKILFSSGLTDRLIPASEDHTLPSLYSLGITDLVDRPSCSADELSDKEMVAAVPSFLQKVVKYRPRAVCFIGMGMWLNVEKGFKRAIVEKGGTDSLWSTLASPGKTPFSRSQKGMPNPRKRGTKGKAPSASGLQPYKVVHPKSDTSPVSETIFFSSPSSSGLAASVTLAEKIELLQRLRDYVRDHKSGVLDTTNMQEVPI
ncbi:DNA glycosylase [Phellopilus nigrolimitatus]|nr:DNA glycosylase [Phellopilus nigrolimitatus]